MFVLGGTSSSGKTSIASKFPKKYKIISGDDYLKQIIPLVHKKIKNKYHTNEQWGNIAANVSGKYLADVASKHSNYVIDIVDDCNPYIMKFLPPKCKLILVYTDLSDLVRNLKKRFVDDPRGMFVFDQFVKCFVKTKNKKEAIDVVNVKFFIKDLNQMKYNFDNKKELESFAKRIFKKMDIIDNKNNYIKVRNKVYKFIVKTKGKSPNELKNEILNLK